MTKDERQEREWKMLEDFSEFGVPNQKHVCYRKGQTKPNLEVVRKVIDGKIKVRVKKEV